MNKKLIYNLAGAAVAALSTALIADFAVRKKKEKSAYAGMLIAGIAGLAVGAALAYQPEKEAKKKLVVEDMLDDNDVALMQENISEVLGSSTAERGKVPEKLRQIEVDEEATIADFI